MTFGTSVKSDLPTRGSLSDGPTLEELADAGRVGAQR